MERLQKIISAAGIASRRKAEEFITSGLVQVNGQTITELGAKADASKDHIRVNGKLIKFSGRHVYILLNKPKGYVTTLSDPEGRPTIVDLLQGVKERVYPVGRLDYASEGLLLLTNDGELANALTKAASHVPKTYLVKVSGQPSDAAIEQLRAGIELPDRKGIHSRTAPAGIQLAHKSENPWYEVTLIEGRNRQIRAMFEQTGHHVEKLKRVRYGPFTLDVHPGKFRHLLPEEVDQLRSAIERGAGASAEDAVRPETFRPAQSKSHITAELREEASMAPKPQPVAVRPASMRPAFARPAQFKREPKLFGKFAARPRPASRRSDSGRPAGPRGKIFSKGFVKKGPFTADSRRERPDRDSNFAKREGAGTRRPARPGQRPEWKKPAARSTGEAPRDWKSASPRPNSGQRPLNPRGSRPAPDHRGGERPVWKRPSPERPTGAGSGTPRAAAPRKWTQGAPPSARSFTRSAASSGASARPGARTFVLKEFDKDRSASSGPKPDRAAKPFGERQRRDSGTDRPDRAPRVSSQGPRNPAQLPSKAPSKAPFWQSADKRRPRKAQGAKSQAEGETEGNSRRNDERPRQRQEQRPDQRRPKRSKPR